MNDNGAREFSDNRVMGNGDDEAAANSEREQTAALRREVGRCARAAWDALQHTLASFARAKVGATDRLLTETGHACDAALVELDRLEQALRSLREDIAAAQRESRAGQETNARQRLFDERVSDAPD